jgi:uncharacterized protein YkwD
METIRRLALVFLALTAASVVGPSTAGASTASDEREVVRQVNVVRAQHGLKPLRAAAPLTRSARLHSRDMGQRRYFAHVSKSGTTFVQRIRAQAPGQIRWLAENIGWGVGEPGTPAGIVDAWMNSAPHRRNLLDSRLNRIGVGAWRGTFESFSGATVYTANFAG